MFKRLNFFPVLMAVILSLVVFSHVYADMTDKATLGGQDSNNNYSWRVDANHNLIPGTSNQNNLGGSSNLVAGLYVMTITASGNAVISGNLAVSGNATFSGSLTGVNWNQFPGGIGAANWQSLGFNQGINWYAVPQGLTSGLNWQGADILTSGINWENVRMKSTPGNNASGTNWQAFGV